MFELPPDTAGWPLRVGWAKMAYLSLNAPDLPAWHTRGGRFYWPGIGFSIASSVSFLVLLSSVGTLAAGPGYFLFFFMGGFPPVMLAVIGNAFWMNWLPATHRA